ncbi:TPA: GNAT family N-acetyltransferase, partial [Vibrio diabolicus]
MKIDVYRERDKLGTLLLLREAFDSSKTLVETKELVIRLVCRNTDNNEIVAHAAGYVREMDDSSSSFIGGIIGDVAVSAKFQKKGIATDLIKKIHLEFNRLGVKYSFLFAYNTKIYKKMGYSE